MKRSFRFRLLNLLFLCGLCVNTSFAEKLSEGDGVQPKQVLIVGLKDNVRSNYFYKGMIAEETGMQADSVDFVYNHIIAENIAGNTKSKAYKFVLANEDSIPADFFEEVKINENEEECASDLSSVPLDEMRKIMNDADADYLLVLNQHYLKWQDQPLRTLFHIVSYSLFDKDKKEIITGNNFFTCMNLEEPNKIRKMSKKSSVKIASNVIKALED